MIQECDNCIIIKVKFVLGLYLVKGEESIGLTLNYNSNEDNGFTGYTKLYVVHSDPELHSIRVQTKEGK